MIDPRMMTHANEMARNARRADELYDTIADEHPEVLQLLWIKLARALASGAWMPEELARDAEHHARMERGRAR